MGKPNKPCELRGVILFLFLSLSSSLFVIVVVIVVCVVVVVHVVVVVVVVVAAIRKVCSRRILGRDGLSLRLCIWWSLYQLRAI